MKKLILSSLGLAIFLLMLACGSNKNLTVEETRSPEELIKVGDQLYQQGQYQKALDTYNRLLIFYPTSDLDIEAKLRIARCYSKLEKYEKQMDVLLQLLKENLIPEYVPNIFIQIGEYYEQAALFNPEESHSDTVDYKTAISYYDKAYHYEDSNNEEAKADALYHKALALVKIGQNEEAVETYKTIVQEFPESPYAVLAQIKLMNPTDLSPLSTMSDSLAVYKKRLAEAGKTIPQTQEGAPEAAPESNQSFEEYLNQNPAEADTTSTEAAPVDTSTVVQPDTSKQ